MVAPHVKPPWGPCCSLSISQMEKWSGAPTSCTAGCHEVNICLPSLAPAQVLAFAKSSLITSQLWGMGQTG